MLIKVHLANTVHEVHVPSSGTVSSLRAAITSSVEGASSPHRSLRLIFAGRVLREDDTPLIDLNMTHGCSVHVVMGPPTVAHAAAAAVEEEAQDGQPRLGFDRLRMVGLDDADVSVLRSTYLSAVVESMGPSMPLQPGESEEARIRRMEDAWIRSQPVDSEFALNLRPLLMQRFREMHGGQAPPHAVLQEELDAVRRARSSGDDGEDQGNVSSLICGVIVGLVGGILMLIFLLHPRMSRRFKSGIVAGVMLSIMVSYLLPKTDAPQSTGALVQAVDAPWPEDSGPVQRIQTLRRMLRGRL